MTVPAQTTTRTEAVGNGLSTVFAFEFLCLESRDLQVSIEGAILPPSQYAVSGLGQHQGGTVTLVDAPANGARILMELAVVADRQNDYQDFGDLFAGTVNFDFDRIWLAIQSAVGNLRRALQLGLYDTDGSGSYRANNNRIQDLGDPIAMRDAVHRQWVDARISEAAIDGAGEFVVERLADTTDPENGAGMVSYGHGTTYPIGTTGYALEQFKSLSQHPTVQANHITPAITRSDNEYTDFRDSLGDSLYRHAPRLVRDAAGMFHMVYSRGKMHGYGGQPEVGAVDPEGQIVYVRSWDCVNWTDEHVICTAMPPDAGLNPFRDVFGCQIGITPSGRIVVIANDIPPPSSEWGRYTGNTRYRYYTNDARGDSNAWVDGGVFWEADGDYARVYCNNIKTFRESDGSHVMVFLDYYRNSDGDIVVGQFESRDEFQTPPTRAANVMVTLAATEADICQVDPLLHFIVARGSWTTAMSTDGRQTWQIIGTSADFDRILGATANPIAPTLDVLWRSGDPYILMGWSERGVSPRSIRWASSSVKDLFTFRDAAASSQKYTPWTVVSQTGPTFTGSEGYHSPVIFPDGSCIYADTSTTSVDPVTGLMRAQNRIVRCGLDNLLPRNHGMLIGSKRTWLRQYNEDENPYAPELIGAGSTGTGTPIASTGTGTRIGNRCMINGTLSITNQNGYAGSLRIDGLPYRSMDGLSQLVNVVVTSSMASGWNASDSIVGMIISNSNYIALYKYVAATKTLSGLSANDLGTNFSCHIAGSYRCRFPGDQ